MVSFDAVFWAAHPMFWTEVAAASSAARAVNEWEQEPFWFVRTNGRLTMPVDLGRRPLRRALQACIAAKAMDVRPEDLDITRRCPACGDPDHGPPVVAVGERVVHLSSSSVGDAFVFSLGPAPFGVDLMRADSLSGTDIETARRATDGGWSAIEGLGFGPEATWTGLEALAKTTGLGLAADAGQIAAALALCDLRWFEPQDGLVMAVASPAGESVRPFAVLDLDRGAEVAARSLTPVFWHLVESAS